MKAALFALATLFAPPASADNVGLPADTPNAYKTECGGCHAPFPPSLLSAGEWQITMTRLDRHFGADASLDARTGADLGVWLGRHAGRGGGAAPAAEPRLTTGRWFVREHREVTPGIWKDPKVKSPANCGACHRGADRGRYGERELVVPGRDRRHGDD